MPQKVLPNQASFNAFERSLIKRGFRKISKPEFKSDFKRLNLIAPSPREGREAGFSFFANGLTVVVWTTFVELEGCARDVDAGWVLIKQRDMASYFAHPLHRTEHFLKRLLEQACIARVRVLNRPLCPLCKAYMNITQGRALKARYWSCRRPSHFEYVHLPWDYGLPEVVLDRLTEIRRKRAAYRAKQRKEGKTPGVALLRRKRWKVGKPKNILD